MGPSTGLRRHGGVKALQKQQQEQEYTAVVRQSHGCAHAAVSVGRPAHTLTEPVPSRFIAAGSSPLILTFRCMLVNRDPATSIFSVWSLLLILLCLLLLLLLSTTA